MALQFLNLGQTPNGGEGDSLRAGGEKINENFREIFSGEAISNAVTAATPSDTDVFGIRQAGGFRKLTFQILWNWILQRLTERTHPVVVLSGTTQISQSDHNNRILVLNPGASLIVDANAVTSGFSCFLLNRTGTNFSPVPLNFSTTDAYNADDLIKIRLNGMAAITTVFVDSSTKIFRISGELTD